MTLSQSDVTELLAAIRAGGDLDVIRKGVELVLQALIEAEATEVIGAERYERSDGRRTWRNGSRQRLLTTKAGDVELAIPKLRSGSFFPSILERRRRIDRALFAVVMEAYVHGVSTRKVDDLVAALGATSGISKSEVSRICGELDTEMAAFRSRPLGQVEFPYVFCDATYLKGRVRGQVVSRAVVVATGITANGDREVLGLAVGDSEDKAFCCELLRSLRARGLSGVRLVISDHHLGLKEAISEVMIGAGWQRSAVVDQPPRAPAPGDQAALRRRGGVPQRCRHRPPGHSGHRRTTRRMAGERPALPVRNVDGPAATDTSGAARAVKNTPTTGRLRRPTMSPAGDHFSTTLRGVIEIAQAPADGCSGAWLRGIPRPLRE